MKSDNITRLVITRRRGRALGEHHGDMKLAQSQLVASKTRKPSKAQAAAEIASFRKNISALSPRQLKELHARLTQRLGSLALAKVMADSKASK